MGGGVRSGLLEEVVLHPTCCAAPLNTPQLIHSYVVFLEKVCVLVHRVLSIERALAHRYACWKRPTRSADACT